MSESAIEKTYALFNNPANRKLVSDLKKTGATVLEFPPVETEKIILDESTITKLKNLGEFDWLIFPDVLAAEFFLENLEELETDLFELDSLRICAVGEAVSDRLRFVQIHADVIPQTIESETIYSAIIDYAGEDELKNLKFLYAKEISSADDLIDKLTEKTALVFELPIYRTKITHNSEITRLKILLENGAVDEFIFTAPTDFIALGKYFADAKLKDIFSEIKVSAADGVNFQTAAEHKIEKVSLFRLDKLVKVNG